MTYEIRYMKGDESIAYEEMEGEVDNERVERTVKETGADYADICRKDDL